MYVRTYCVVYRIFSLLYCRRLLFGYISYIYILLLKQFSRSFVMELNIRVAVWPFMVTKKEEEENKRLFNTLLNTRTHMRTRTRTQYVYKSVEIHAKVEHIIRPHHLLTERRENKKNDLRAKQPASAPKW